MQKQTFATVVQARGDEPSITISSIALDRDADVIVPEGADLTAYRKNPVVGFQHFRTDPLPVGATTSIEVEPGKGIKARWRWLENDPLADRVRNAFDQGVLRAASIGFLPTEWSDMRETGGRRYEKWQLLEWSLVAVPANPEAVRVLRSLDLWGDDGPILEIADDDDVIDMDDETASALATLAAEGRAKLARMRMNPACLAGLIDPVFEVDEKLLARLIAEVCVEGMREVARETTVRALNKLRGRAD